MQLSVSWSMAPHLAVEAYCPHLCLRLFCFELAIL